jgi:hypothetical protein
MRKLIVIAMMVLVLMLGHVLNEQRLVAEAMQAEIISLQRAIDAAK